MKSTKLRLPSGGSIELDFTDDGEFLGHGWVSSKKLTKEDIEMIYQEMNDAEMYGETFTTEGEEDNVHGHRSERGKRAYDDEYDGDADWADD